MLSNTSLCARTTLGIGESLEPDLADRYPGNGYPPCAEVDSSWLNSCDPIADKFVQHRIGKAVSQHDR